MPIRASFRRHFAAFDARVQLAVAARLVPPVSPLVRANRHRPELADFNKGTYQGTSIPAFWTDLNRKLAFAKEHEPDLAAVGAGKDFQLKLETKLRALETDSGAESDGAAIAS